MFDADVFLSIVLIYIMIVISPGPNFVLITQFSLSGDIDGAIGLMLGFAIGATANACITMFGLASVFISLPAFGLIISLIGGSYLTYLGVKTIRSALIENSPNLAIGDCSANQRTNESKNYKGILYLLYGIRKGIVVNLLNPKGIVFFVGLYAPLISNSNYLTKVSVLLAGFSIEIIWYLLVIYVLSREKYRDIYNRSGTLIEIILGTLLTFIGIRFLFESRKLLV